MKDIKIIFQGQILHILTLAVLLGIIWGIIKNNGFLAGQYLGISTSTWFYLSIGFPILHQVYVWFGWRTQLYFSLFTRLFGRAGFILYSVGFLFLFFLRILSVIFLSISSRNSLPAYHFELDMVALIITIPLLYLLYSVGRYFGIKRALGIDHFDESYRSTPLVKEGIFRFVSNSMCTFGMTIFWIPGLIYASKAALLVALFNHIYIWVHYYATEKPDMKRIYRSVGN